MSNSTFSFSSPDNTPLQVYQWVPQGEVKGLLQIIHGMGDHASRYSGIVEYFQKKGFLVFADDHRGHGHSAPPEDLGHLYPGDHKNLVRDQKALSDLFKGKYPGIPLYVLGHSMGSFILRAYLADYKPQLAGGVICGTAGRNIPKTFIGKVLARFRMVRGKKADHLLDKVAFAGYNKRYKERKSPFDWICSSPQVVEDYEKDPFCGFVPTSGFFYELGSLLHYVSKKKSIRSVPGEIPLLFIAGGDDPVGGYGKGVLKVAELFRNQGSRQLTCKIYPKGRHEILNETFKEEVYRDIGEWIDGL